MADTINLASIARLAQVPPKLGEAGKIGGDVKVRTESYAPVRDNAGAVLVATDIVRYFRVRSSEIPLMIACYHDAVGVNGVGAAGLYGINGGAAVDTTLFGNILLKVAADPDATPGEAYAEGGQTPQFLTFDGTSFDSAVTLGNNVDNTNAYTATLWQMLGLLVDPKISFDLAVTITETQSTASWLSIVYLYVDTA